MNQKCFRDRSRVLTAESLPNRDAPMVLLLRAAVLGVWLLLALSVL